MSSDTYESYAFADGPLRALGLKALHGANYFSAGPVIILRLDLGEYDEVFTNDVPGFHEQLKTALPSLHEHFCSPGHPGGFFERVAEGTLLGHVTEHTAIELQTLAGMDVGYGKTRGTATQGIYNVVFRFLDEHVGLYTAKAALNFVNSILTGIPFDVDTAVDTLIRIREDRLLGPSTQAIVDEANRRRIPALRLDEHNLVQLGSGRFQKRIRATISSDTSLLPVETADNKYLTTRMLADAGVPVPPTIRTADPDEVLRFHEEMGGNLVVKPCEGHLGQGISLDLDSADGITEAVEWALEFDDTVIAQPMIAGESYRLLVIDFKFVAAVKLSPPEVVGDGEHSVAALIGRLNDEPGRGPGDKTSLSFVEIDDITERILKKRGVTADTVLPSGCRLPLKVSGSLRLGGRSEDVTDRVHPVNRMLAERACRAIGLNAAGVDMVAGEMDDSILDTGGAVIEVGAAPDFRMHLMPAAGTPRNVAEPFVDMMFPTDRESRVPVIAVTGTEGKTAAVNLLRHALAAAHYRVGLASSEGLFVADEALKRGDMTGFEAASMTLKDPTIDCAVLEVPVETILERGLGYEYADVGIVLNVHDEGKTYDETRDLEDIGYAKSVVAEQVYDDGTAVLNCDDDLVWEMRDRVYGSLVLFSRDLDNARWKEHIEDGGRAVVLEQGRIVIHDRKERIDLIQIEDLPLHSASRPTSAVEIILATVGALYAFGLSVVTIQEALVSHNEEDRENHPET